MNFNNVLNQDGSSFCDEEDWCFIPNFPNYEASIYGDVLNSTTGRRLRLSKNNSGYLSVTLYNECGPASSFVHHIIVDTFLRFNRCGLEVNHKQCDKTNNRLDNLEIITKAENTQHAIDNNLRRPPNEKRIRIIETNEIFVSVSACARYIGAKQNNITAVLHGRKSSVKGFHFEFID